MAMPGCEHGRALYRVAGDTYFFWRLEPSCGVGEGHTDKNEIATIAATRHRRRGRMARLGTAMFKKVKLRPSRLRDLEGLRR